MNTCGGFLLRGGAKKTLKILKITKRRQRCAWLFYCTKHVNDFEFFEFRNAELSQDVLLPTHTKTLGDAQRV